ncbi:MAG: DUF4260 domain-containing protein [Longimicrobiales bacterium]
MSGMSGLRAGWTPLLRLEGLAVLLLALTLFSTLDGSWLLFALLVLLPDLSMLGYLGGARVGAITYNAAHTYLGPALLGGAAWWLADPLSGHVALIWTSHIGLDRLFGFGLKLPTGFGDTHLGSIGKGG